MFATAPVVESSGNRIQLHFDTLEQALQLFSPWKGANRRAEAANEIHQALAAVGLQMEVWVKGVRVAAIGASEFKGSLLRMLGIEHTPERAWER